MPASAQTGALALVGGGEWHDGCTFDRELLEASGTNTVVVLPTAAAYEGPREAVDLAARWFAGFGAETLGLMVLGRPDAQDEAHVAAVRGARFIYLADGSPLHLRSVLKSSPLWQALVEAWRGGAVLAASAAGAMVLGDPMVDPRGGAFTLGLGLLENVAVMPHTASWSHDRLRRTTQLLPAGVVLVAIDEATALIRSPRGGWKIAGVGGVRVWADRQEASLDALPA